MAPISIPSKPVDVVVIGGGPAGMMASLCCNTYGLKVLHIDERDGPTKAGRADGIQRGRQRSCAISAVSTQILLNVKLSSMASPSNSQDQTLQRR